MQDILRHQGYHVILETRGNQVIELVKKEKPDLVLLDLQLPGVDGYSLLKSLKSDSSTKAIPIIAVTAYALKGDRQKAMDAGCEEYISKPIDTRELPRIVKRFFEGGVR